VKVKMTALINDTTGTLIASHYVRPATRIAVIFGTGCNAAYMERVGDIPKLAGLGLDPDAQMAINCEWVRACAAGRPECGLNRELQGAFDSFTHEHLPRTRYDLVVDGTSNKPGEQAFEVHTP
jgi:hexokinase